MTRAKRLFAFVLCLVFIVSALVTPAAAAKPIVIKNFGSKTNIDWNTYYALRDGTMTVDKYRGKYHYKFVRNGTTVYVHPDAFKSSAGNNFESSVNKKLENTIKAGKGEMDGYNAFYKEKAANQRVWYKVSRSKTLVATKSVMYLSHLVVYADRSVDDRDITLQCEKKNHVQFEYMNQVRSGNKLKTPTTKSELQSALKITTKTVSTTVVPTFEMRVEKPGSKNIKISMAKYEGKGQVEKVKVTDCIDVGITTGKVVASTILGTPSYIDIYKLGVGTQKIVKTKKGGVYASEGFIQTKGKHNNKTTSSTYASKFESPFALKANGDRFTTTARMSGTYNNKGATLIDIKFTAK